MGSRAVSAETSVGQFPVPAVAAINRIAAETEQFLARTDHGGQQPSGSKVGFTWAVAHGANLLARELSASLVATWTESGYTAGLLSKHRPPQPIVALSPDQRVCRQMALCYGVYPIQTCYSLNRNNIHIMIIITTWYNSGA